MREKDGVVAVGKEYARGGAGRPESFRGLALLRRGSSSYARSYGAFACEKPVVS
jgi:hypothetical protein